MRQDSFAPQDRGHLSWPFEVYGRSTYDAPLRLWLLRGRAPVALVFAAIHGDEPETTVALGAALCAVPLEALTCAVVLCANPDGAALGVRGNAHSVDLNHNFPTANWGPPLAGQLSTGSAPGSEVETQALIALVERLRPTMVLSIHSDLACIDDPTASHVSHWLAEERSGLPLVAAVGYPTPGSFGTWRAEADLPVVTLELERLGTQDLRQRWGPILANVLSGVRPSPEQRGAAATLRGYPTARRRPTVSSRPCASQARAAARMSPQSSSSNRARGRCSGRRGGLLHGTSLQPAAHLL